MIKRKKYAASGGAGGVSSGSTSTAVWDLLPHGGPYPPTKLSSPYRTRPFPLEPGRINGRMNQPTPSQSSWDTALSPGFDDAEEIELPGMIVKSGFTSKADKKRREVGWSTSFPAEYYAAHQTHDYQQTLAYQEQVNQQKHKEQQLTQAVIDGGVPSSRSIAKGSGSKVSFPNAPSPNRQELELFKHVTMREGILEKLKTLAHDAGATGFEAETGTDLLQLLLQLRDASVTVISAMAQWHQSMTSHTSRPPAFLYQGHNYCAKMTTDLNFLATFSSLGRVLGVDPARMKQNPFMMPSPIPDREFHDMESHSASSPPRFSFDDPIERVAEAEKYLVWSLVNLPEGIGNVMNGDNTSLPSQHAPQPQSQPRPLTFQGKRELLSWQQRAEQQLRLLSMPLESPTGQARMMDSSRMMKRKGYLPSLPQSPPKTLTQLMENVHKGGYTSPTKSNCLSSLEAIHDGISYRMTALDIEVLGSNDAAPHAIVTLVAASVLILLSPSDRIPKDLSWASCQKMLSNGLALIRRIERVDMDAIPAFKWKALLPFLQNKHYDPMFLMEYTSAAATLCAWVLHVLEHAQHKDRVLTNSEQDRHEILEELEYQDEQDPSSNAVAVCTSADTLRPISRGRGSRRGSGKRVTIGSAEVLFINENEPVLSPPSTASGSVSGGSRPASSSSSSAVSGVARRHVLLRTSPWTHRGVTYFVSFFLEKRDDDPESHDDVLSIKLYEPMSSVESQMFVSSDDLRLDFGVRAAELFARRDFGLLCDLVLTQLDSMMAPLSRGGLNSKRDTWRRQSETEAEAVKPDAQTVGVEGAAVRIQSLVRSASARKEVLQRKREKETLDAGVQLHELHIASVRIQCAARQRHARKKVQSVRFAKQQAMDQRQQQSATTIQSVARQRHAQKQIAHMKLLQRTPTGLTPPSVLLAEEDEDEDDDQVTGEDADVDEDNAVATRLAALQTLEITEPSGDDPEQDADQEPLEPMPMEDVPNAIRPETSMSYTSEQFEDDFEAEDA